MIQYNTIFPKIPQDTVFLLQDLAMSNTQQVPPQSIAGLPLVRVISADQSFPAMCIRQDHQEAPIS
jgi:hypothetical protein